MKFEIVKEHVPGTDPVWNCFWRDEKDKLLMKAWIFLDGNISIRKFEDKQDIEYHIKHEDFKVRKQIIKH